MNTICSLSSTGHQGIIPAPASGDAPSQANTRLQPVGAEKFVSLVCLAAVASVIICICFTHPNTSLASSAATPSAPGVKATPFSGEIPAAKSLAQNAGDAPRRHPFSSAAINTSQAAAMPGLNPAPRTHVWSMIGIGFFLLIARGRAFGAATR
jgi:hypothetical protein